MPIYTRSGDRGETDLLGGARVPKDCPALEVCGALDELNALVGLVRSQPLPEGAPALLQLVQRHLFQLGSEIVARAANQCTAVIGSEEIAAIEQLIDRYESQLKPTDSFILPAGSSVAAMLHLARVECRRVERRLVTLAAKESALVSPAMLAYANRLSDLFFILARAANAQAGIADELC